MFTESLILVEEIRKACGVNICGNTHFHQIPPTFKPSSHILTKQSNAYFYSVVAHVLMQNGKLQHQMTSFIFPWQAVLLSFFLIIGGSPEAANTHYLTAKTLLLPRLKTEQFCTLGIYFSTFNKSSPGCWKPCCDPPPVMYYLKWVTSPKVLATQRS